MELEAPIEKIVINIVKKDLDLNGRFHKYFLILS